MGRVKRSVFKPGFLEQGVYLHVYNHYCGDSKQFPFGDVEKEKFLKHLKLTLQLYVIECLSAVVMSNHFHLILYVPKERLSLKEMAEKIKRAKLGRMFDERCEQYVTRRAEMSNELSDFMKELQQGFTCWFNRTRMDKRRGTLWEQRFKCSKLADISALATCLLYVEMNAVRAGLVHSTNEYRFCSFGIWQQSGNHPFAESLVKHMGYGFLLIEPERNLIGIEAHMRSRLASLEAFFHGKNIDEADAAAEEAASKKPGASLIKKSRFWIDSVVLGGKITLKEQAVHFLGEERAAKRRFGKAYDDGETQIFSLRQLVKDI